MNTDSWETAYRLHWPLAGWATVLLVVAVVAWVAAIYQRESPAATPRQRVALTLLRLTAAATLVLMWAQPSVERRRVAPPLLRLLIDRSASMGETDAEYPSGSAPISRLSAAQQAFSGELIEQISKRFTVEVVPFADALEIDPPDDSQSGVAVVQAITLLDADAGGTRIGSAVAAAVRDASGPPPAALILVTDGVSTSGLPLADAARLTRSSNVPLFTVAVGSPRPRPDAAVEDLLVEHTVFPGDWLPVEVRVRWAGLPRQTARVILSAAGPDGRAAREVDAAPLELSDAEGSQTVQLVWQPDKPGPWTLRAELASVAEDVQPENNGMQRIVEVRPQRIRTLLAASRPTYEFRALKSLLERDPAIRLHTYLDEADPEFHRVDRTAVASFPADAEAWDAYDVLLLDDVATATLPRGFWRGIQRWVSESGGGLALIPGPRHLPWEYVDNNAFAVLAPLKFGRDERRDAATGSARYAILPTAQGRSQASLQLGGPRGKLDALWLALPPVEWLAPSAGPRLGATVLATATRRSGDSRSPWPAIARQYVGKGEVVMHATDETWRWRWRNDDRYFARYWGQTVRRLARGRSDRSGPQLTTDRLQYQAGETVRVIGRGFPPSGELQLELIGASQPRRTAPIAPRLGRETIVETTLENLPPDDYQLRWEQDDQRASARFRIERAAHELAKLTTDAAALAAAADDSGGKSYPLQAVGRLVHDLPTPSPTVLEQLPDEPLWSNHWFVAALCLAASSEWLLRRKWGLL